MPIGLLCRTAAECLPDPPVVIDERFGSTDGCPAHASGAEPERPGPAASQRQTEHGRSMGSNAQSGCHQPRHSRIRERTALYGLGEKQMGQLRFVYANEWRLCRELPAVRY